MSDRLPAYPLPDTPAASEDPLQSVFNVAEQMLDSLDVQRGTVLALRIIIDHQTLTDDTRAAVEALTASLIYQAQILRVMVNDLHRVSMAGAA